VVEGMIELEPVIEEGLYRIAREALNNALKHSQARQVRILLKQEGNAVLMEVADNGVGFDVATPCRRQGMGLSNMEERAKELGGCVTVLTSPGEGTCVRVEVSL
jgi:signal transduction histidine kinase